MMYVLNELNVVPNVDYYMEEGEVKPVIWFFGCTLAGCTVFFLLLFSYMGIRQTLGLTQPSCFLDKVCIHQTNADLKAAGIDAISTFLYSSKKMIVLYDAGYFSRLSRTTVCVCAFFGGLAKRREKDSHVSRKETENDSHIFGDYIKNSIYFIKRIL